MRKLGAAAVCPVGGKAGSGTGDNMRYWGKEADIARTLWEPMVNEVTQRV